MLSIKTDLPNIHWLIYITEEFRRINLAQFNIEILSLEDTPSSKNVIYYTQQPNQKLSVYNSSEKPPSKNIEYIKNNLFILENTRANRFTVEYDLFWNAFVFLSRYEEHFSEQNGKPIYSYSLNHPRTDKRSFDIPIVNILFNELEQLITENFPLLTFGEKQEPVIDLSHDVDYLKKTVQLRLKQTAFNTYNTIKNVFKPAQFIKHLSKTISFAVSSPSYWCFDYWQDLEKKHHRRSTFYVYVKTGRKDFRSWLIDPSYDIQTDTKLQAKLKELKDNGFEIGLHGSYYSAKEFSRLKEEKEILENILGCKVTKTRQHWLNYFENVTPFNHNRLFQTDSTLGWNDRMGFRSGIASAYRPYNFKEKKAFNYTIIPQVIMDSNVYEYSSDPLIFKKAKKLIALSKQISKTTCISISWHQRVCSPDYKWHTFYEELLNDL